MPRNISFFLTTQQVRDSTKTVTRRLGWRFLKVGDVLNACVKCQGLGKGGKIEKICQIRIIDVRQERLYKITQEDVVKEGFSDYSRQDFIEMFMKNMKCAFNTLVNRIEFEYI